MTRFQVRKREGRWEVYVFRGRFWDLVDRFFSYEHAMILATGQAPYRDVPGVIRTLSLAWRSA
jgi:hypothetical protein